MDLTTLADPAELTKLLTGIFGVKLGTWLAAYFAWQGLARTAFVPVRKQIQQFADAVIEFSHRSGNTEIHRRFVEAESSVLVRWVCFILNYVLSIKLGPERDTTTTTVTKTATASFTTTTEAPVASVPPPAAPEPKP